MTHNYKKLLFWKKSKELSIDIYKITKEFPDDERFGLTSQMRRCAVSVASNIAEGSSRSSVKDFRRFLEISMGSIYELEVQLMISNEVGYISDVKTKELTDQIKSLIEMMSKFKSTLR